MTEDDNKLSTEMVHGVFNAAQSHVIDDVARNMDDEEVAEALTKDDFEGSGLEW